MSDTQNPEPESNTPSGDETAQMSNDRASESTAPSAKTPRGIGRIRRSTLILAAVIAVLVIALGITMTNLVNTNAALAESEAHAAAIQTQSDEFEGDLELMTTSRDQYRDASTKVSEREIAVSKLEDEVEEREKAVKATEEHIAATTLKDGYAYTVGLTMEPGVYEANATGSTCYWKITTSGTNYSDIVENDLGKAGVLRVTVSPGQDFQSQRCGEWHKVG
ncbi:hypothetical protein [Agromyces allii]|uniref:Uncharacterized protein n=1 Tax=Agromyces allii TaxID=393607 RepID=A0ABN2Q5Q8_9MICO|nr:hypothetical protein [Agromyces allii]